MLGKIKSKVAWFRSLFALEKPYARPRCELNFRPRVEFMEPREVPATLRWTDALSTGLSQDAGNWQVEDSPGSWVTAMRPPARGDDLRFDGATSNASCALSGFNAPESLADFNSISLVNNYSGTVTLASDGSAGLSANTFTLTSGAISQPAANTELTVLSDFSWTGGTLNSSTFLSTVTLSGATATFAPASGGTVYCGSIISLKNGAVGTLKEGTVELQNNASEFIVHESSGLFVDPGEDKTGRLEWSPGVLFGKSLRVSQDAWLTLLSGSYISNNAVNNFGVVTLMSDTLLFAAGPQPNTNAYTQTGGATLLYGGSTIQSLGWVEIKGGLLSTVGGSSGNSSATIASLFRFTGGDIYIDGGSDVHHYGTLTVTGNMEWTGGTFHPFVEGEHVQSDVLAIDGMLLIGGPNCTAALAPAALDGEGNPIMPSANKTWTILTATGGITAFVPAYNTSIWTLTPVGEPQVRRWDLTT
jgi:hypothetical protein